MRWWVRSLRPGWSLGGVSSVGASGAGDVSSAPDVVGWLVGVGIVGAGWALFVRMLLERVARLERSMDQLAEATQRTALRVERVMAAHRGGEVD